MGRKLTKEELIKHKEDALKALEQYMDNLIENPNIEIQGKSDKLSYWIEDWTTFLAFEPKFSPSSLRRYKRGEIIKVHLGYNVGSEEGGLHYCVVIEKNNSRNSPVVTIVPLTSVKKKTDLNHLHKGNIYLGNELFTNLSSKITYTDKTLSAKMNELEKAVQSFLASDSDEGYENIKQELDTCRNDNALLKRMQAEVLKMKMGSIALVSQIRTISKIRIYDPKTNYDILSNVKLSNEKLDLIDEEILRNFTRGK